MSLFRASGAPGGLSINTSSANMFGSSTSQPPAAGGLFGGSTTTTATTQPAAASGGLFGTAAATTTPKPGGLFGTATSTTTPAAAPTQQTPSLFGSTAPANTSQPQQTSSLFGNALNTQQQQQQPTQTGGLFGAAQTQTQTPGTGGGLFGNTAQNQTQAQGTGGGLFGAANTTAQPATATPSPFGASLAQPATNGLGGSLLGQAAQPRTSVFGGLGQQSQPQTNNAFGQKPAVGLGGSLGFGLTMGQSNAQQTVPGVRIDASNIKGTTRFNDLQEDLQKQIEQMDAFIVAQMQKKKEVDGFMSGYQDMLESIPNDVQFVARKYDGARNALETAAQSIEAARLLVNQDADHARLSFRAVDNLKFPQQFHTTGFWSPRQGASGNANAESDGQDLVGFFSQTADEMAEQMNKYEKNLTEIENHMHGVSDSLVEQLTRMMATKNGSVSGPDEKIQELVAVLRDFEQGILRVAGDIGSVKEGLTQLQLGDFIEP
ncbi:hypothetical protein F5Y16DRAFT_177616 [Xylariaceae sp. FL0255]|nr:hypothetical protein F5Y16DRAFT_177616 [Xylariaceae sp. FL0255]